MVIPAQVSDFGVAFIRRHEGECLKAYRDINGLLTIGVGHLLPQTPESESLVWTAEEVKAQLAKDLAEAVTFLRIKVMVPLSQPQLDALASFLFNVGSGHFVSSTVLAELNKGRYQSAGKAFLMWDGHGILAGRREQEKAIWDYGSI